jgi:hypothetical protein
MHVHEEPLRAHLLSSAHQGHGLAGDKGRQPVHQQGPPLVQHRLQLHPSRLQLPGYCSSPKQPAHLLVMPERQQQRALRRSPALQPRRLISGGACLSRLWDGQQQWPLLMPCMHLIICTFLPSNKRFGMQAAGAAEYTARGMDACGGKPYPCRSSSVTASSSANTVTFTSCAPRPQMYLRRRACMHACMLSAWMLKRAMLLTT